MALVAVILAIGSFLSHPSATEVRSTGSVTTGTAFPHGVTIGAPASSPTNMANVIFGACSLIASSFTVAASSTAGMDCAVPGTVATDGVFAQFATSTTIGSGGWSIRGASASSTAGFITISVANGTGASGILPASIASTTKYIVLRAQ